MDTFGVLPPTAKRRRRKAVPTAVAKRWLPKPQNFQNFGEHYMEIEQIYG